MSGIRSRGIVALLFAASTVGTALVGACADSKGALMLAINTDMKAPKDVNAVSVTISTNGAIKHSFIGRVTPQGEVLLPATLAIVEPEDKAASIRIRVMAFQDRKPRVLRDVRTTIPQDGRTALLRIPLNFVNDGSAMGPELPANVLPDPNPGTGGTPSGGGGGASSGGGGPVGGGAGDFDFLGTFTPPPNCDPATQTIIDGECKDSFVDPATLPDFDANQVGDSTNPGSCFDVPKCFAGAVAIGEETGEKPPPVAPADAGGGADSGADGDGERDGGAKFKNFRPLAVTLDRNACSLQLNGANPARLNLALVTPDTGECVRPGECYVPLDRGNGGWKEQNGVVQLPTFVCRLLTGKNLRLATSTETCAAKEESNPICGPPPGAVEPNACVGSKAPPASAPSNMVLRLTQLNLGELDSATNMPAANAWKKIGFDLDGLCTTKEAMDVCARQAGADSAKQEDGEQGIDNAFGRTVLGFLLGLVPTPSKTASEGGGLLQLDAAGNGTLHIPVQGGLWSIPLIDVRVDRKAGEEVVGGTLAARIPVESLVQSVEKIAGRISSQLCGGSTLDTLKQTIRQAADLPLQGQNRLGVPCDAVSIGITFTGTPTEPVTLPPPGPDPCGPMECPRTAPIDATALPAKPARVNPFQCTPPAIDALVSYVLANPNATPAMVKSLGVTDPMCRACVFGPESGNTWAPFVELTAGGLLVNRGGCIEVATSSQNCGRAYQQIYSCVLLACRDCAAGAATSACVNQAAQPGGACAKAVSDAVAICGGPPLGSAETACEGRDLIEGPLKALCGQGVQMN